MLIRSLLILTLAITVSPVEARPLQADTSIIEIRQPPAEKVEEYARDDAFNYQQKQQNAESFLGRIYYWLQQQIQKILNTPGGEIFLDIVFYLGIGILIYNVVRQFLKGDIRGIFLRRDNTKPGKFQINQQNHAEEDWEELIQEAVANNQLGLAIRYLYQKSLVQLKDEGIINWRKNKTNRDYVYEIRSEELRVVFSDVTRYYEYAKYGNFSISKEDFEKVRDLFSQLQSYINHPA